MSLGINVGGIYADLDIRTGNLDRGLAAARQALNSINREIDQLNLDFHDGAILLADYNARMTALGATATELTTRMQAAYRATTSLNTGLELVTRNANGMTAITGRMGQGLMQLGYIADDIQYGFSGIVNNIAPLVGSLTGNAGIAAGAQIAAVAVNQLVIHWDQFLELIGEGTVKTEAEQMEELGKQTKKTADEQERLNKFKEREKQIAKMLAGESKETSDTAKAVQDIYNEAGVKDNIEKTLIDKVIEGIADTPEEQEKLAINRRVHAEDVAKFGENSSDAVESAETGKALQKTIDARKHAEAKALVDGLMLDAMKATPEGADARKTMIQAFGDPNHPLHSVAMQLRSAGPDGIAKANAAAADAAVRTENEKNEKERAEAAKKEDKKKRDAADKDKQKAMGRQAYLEEIEFNGMLTDGEMTELSKLQAAEDKRNETERDKKWREAKQEREANEKEAREMAPGVGKMSDVLALQTMTGAITPDQAREAIAKHLGRQGVDATKTVQAADMIFEESEKDVKEGVMKRMLDGSQGKNKTSQVFDANQLAANFQGSVGGAQDENKKQTSLLEKLEKQVDQIARNRGLNFAGRK